MFQSIITEVDESVGILTLNNADQHNTFDGTLVSEMTRALFEFEADPSVRVLVLSSTGKNFCGGTNLKWIKHTATDYPEESPREARDFTLLMTTLNAFAKPTIARVQGSAFGSGVGLIAACDIAVATYDALFAFTEVKQGQIPATIAPFVLAAIGERYCRRYMLSAERFSAAEAYRIGLIHEIVPGEEQLDEAVGEIVEALLKNGPNAQAQCKSLISALAGQPIDDISLDEAIRRNSLVRSGPEGIEGLAAFIEKRKPHWVI